MGDERIDPIRQAVASGEFERAALLWNEYAAGLQEEIGKGACTPARLAEAEELVEWASRVVVCDRAHAQEGLNCLWVASKYGSADASPLSCYRVSL